MNQEKKIIEYLRTNTEITTLAAYDTFRITRLAARIKDIKNRHGDDAILDRWMITPNATVKAYRLSPAFKAMLDVKLKPFNLWCDNKPSVVVCVSTVPETIESDKPCHSIVMGMECYHCATTCAGLNNCKLKKDGHIK